MIVYTAGNTALRLREPALSSGGEGSVYAVESYPDRVVKLYKNPKEAAQREDKILKMISIGKSSGSNASRLKDCVAWPMGAVYDNHKRFIGFGMQTVHSSIELDDVYCYPPQNNATLSLKDKVEILINLCDVIDRVHSSGQVFADGNPNNIKITSGNKVVMIDADSYHISSGGDVYKCLVCHPEYVAPELSRKVKNGKTYETVPDDQGTFTKETDRYSLAIHCFKMLMNGAHPFNYTDKHKVQSSRRTPKKSLSERVENAESVYFTNVAGKTAPAFAPDIFSLPEYIRNLFKRAFIDGATSPSSRPTATEWRSALIRFKSELVACSKNKSHYYHKSNHQCPYCKADDRYISGKLGAKKTTTKTCSNSADYRRTTTSIVPAQTYQTHTAYNTNATATSSTVSSNTINSGTAFWPITIILSIIASLVLGMNILPIMYNSIAGNSTVTSIGMIGGIICGIIGSILYNALLSSGKRNNTDVFPWYDYVLSLLCCIGGLFGFGLVMGLLYILYYIIIVAIILGIVCLLFGG